MPVAQVVLLYTVHVYNELSDEQSKWFFCRLRKRATVRTGGERRLGGNNRRA